MGFYYFNNLLHRNTFSIHYEYFYNTVLAIASFFGVKFEKNPIKVLIWLSLYDRSIDT